MHVPYLQDILPYVEKPSRYLGTETNRIHKDHSRVRLKIALAFPDLYEIGTSHFGIQILYHLLNQRGEIAAEQVFAPGRDMEARLREKQLPLCTLESQQPLGTFDIIGFSLLYELNYTNVLNMLHLAGIPPRAHDRRPSDPLIIAGGPCVCNPEPMADFLDAMVFGDGESVVLQMADMWLTWKNAGEANKEELLKQWSTLQGVYIPQFYKPVYDLHGFQHLEPSRAFVGDVHRAVETDLDRAGFPDHPIVPFGRPVHDRLRLELSRGCSRGCRFCQAGMLYRPVRERSPLRLIELFRTSLAATGFDDVSLLSLSTSDYSCLPFLMENLMAHCRNEQVALSLPSFRAGTLSPHLMKQIQKVRKTGFTIAPEAGSQRLRDVINKNITFEDVSATVENAFSLGWQVIKLYFMIGLPTETEEDLADLVKMVTDLNRIKKPAKRRGQINVSVTTFIPKPHTPFQWAKQLTLQESLAIMDSLRSRLHTGGIHFKWQHPAMSLIEGVFSRGDRRLGKVLERALGNGCLFDGWNDQFNFEGWKNAFAACGLDPEFFTCRRRDPEEPLPWDHMKSGVTSGFLKDQWQQAISHPQKMEDCRWGQCHGCGICDFSNLQPVVFTSETDPGSLPGSVDQPDPSLFAWREVFYSKTGQARFFGHLEQVNLFARALRRAGIAVQFSKGFHPMPRLSFDDPLPLGMESEAERMRMLISKDMDCDEVIARMNRQLPAGLRLIACRPLEGRKSNPPQSDRFRVRIDDQVFDSGRIKSFDNEKVWIYNRVKGKRGGEQEDLKTWITSIVAIDSQTLIMEILRKNGRILRPAEILNSLFGLSQEQLQGVLIRRLAEDCEDPKI